MPIDDDDDIAADMDPSSFEDPIAQRGAVFVNLARCADELKNDTARELTFTMMRKITTSIRAPSTAEVVSLPGGKKD